MSAASPPTLREALVLFRSSNGLNTDETARTSWVCRFGPVALHLPNFGWRRKAIEAHDLHHVLTDYPCTMSGECQVATWEFAAGNMPHWAASLFCLPLVLVGFLYAPHRTFLAFIAGRQSRSLHGLELSEQLLGSPLHKVRADLASKAEMGGRWLNYLRFALLVLKSGTISLLPIALVIGLWVALRAK